MPFEHFAGVCERVSVIPNPEIKACQQSLQGIVAEPVDFVLYVVFNRFLIVGLDSLECLPDAAAYRLRFHVEFRDNRDSEPVKIVVARLAELS